MKLRYFLLFSFYSLNHNDILPNYLNNFLFKCSLNPSDNTETYSSPDGKLLTRRPPFTCPLLSYPTTSPSCYGPRWCNSTTEELDTSLPPLPPLHISLSCSFLCGSYPRPRGFNLHIRAHYRAFFSSLSRDLLFRSRTQTPMLGVWRTSAPLPLVMSNIA